MSRNLRAVILQQIAHNSDSLARLGRIRKGGDRMAPVFIWPLAQSPGYSYPGYYAISNYVDQDPAAGDNATLDYNCGSRTYDGHKGTDIRISPFPWNKMANEEVRIIAAASGTIVSKWDGNFDQNCEWADGLNWNGIAIEHSDGSKTFYGHMKNGTVTSKDIGDDVSAGEYLGLVGSSGYSTGPHLHFEVYDDQGDLVDPFDGACNSLNNSSWWQSQLPYYDSGINRLITGSAQWENFDCPNPSDIHSKLIFCPGEQIVFSAHYRHDLTDNTIHVRVYEPDGDQSPILNTSYSREGAYHFTTASALWTRNLPQDAEAGMWTFEAEYETTTYGTLNYTTNFWVGLPCQPNYNFAGTHGSGCTYYLASNQITSSADVPVGTEIWYDASNRVILQPGFSSPPGSVLHVKAEGCN